MVVGRWQLLHSKTCKGIVGLHVTTQHRPFLFTVLLKVRGRLISMRKTTSNGEQVTGSQPVDLGAEQYHNMVKLWLKIRYVKEQRMYLKAAFI